MNVEQITKLIFIGCIIFAIIMIAFAFVKKKKLIKKIVIAVMMVVLVIANGAVMAFNNVINQHFSSVKVDGMAVEDATQASKDITTEIEEEGIVLLENKNQTLPLDVSSNPKVNVFGQTSISLIYGGAGSGASDETSNITLEQGLEQAGFEVNDELTESSYLRYIDENSNINFR